jgi:hypothetical protein
MLRIQPAVSLTLGVVAFTFAALGLTAAPAAAASCPTHFIGLHGVGEGTDSPTIVETENAIARYATGKSLTYESLNYPTLDIDQFTSQEFFQDPAVSPIVVGASLLTRRIADRQAEDGRNGCGTSKFLLAGYSEGAWVTDFYGGSSTGTDLIHRGVIAAIVTYGDPQWDQGSQGQGLARRFGGGLDPWLPNAFPNTVQPWCAVKDPVCGQGFDPATVTPLEQLAAAAECMPNSTCEHYAYAKGITGTAGQFLASRA